ncbi:MAG TPA: asparaginase [Rubrivivax sp.]|jgi:L-asparaginase|nr:asparaginase [Rubrivivax sp.]
MQSGPRVVVIGTGGTIAGTARDPASHVGYRAAALDVADLVATVPALRAHPLETISLARLDSSDMDHVTWAQLAAGIRQQLGRPEVAGVVVTHGTDTLEETAYFLHRCLAADKPVVLTAAMRPASAASPDGPQNLLDALLVALSGAPSRPDPSMLLDAPPATSPRGVLAVLCGRIHAGAELRKLHGYRVDAFDSGDAGPLGVVEDGRLRCFRSWPSAQLHPAATMLGDPTLWPVVDIVTSHAGARGATLDALVAAGAQGIVIAGTGNGSVHHSLLAAAQRALAAGVLVRRSSRCVLGGVVGASEQLAGVPSAGALTPVQARIELMLDLIAGNG